MAVVRILGIDPGTLVVGFGCLEVDVEPPPREANATPLALRASNVVRPRSGGGDGDVRLRAMGVFRLGDRATQLAQRLMALAEQFRALLAEVAPHEVALEEAFFGKSVQAALRVGEARGVVLAEAARAGLAVHQYSPARVKRCVTGRGNATKETVAAMVAQWTRSPHVGNSGQPADATDALAVAWTRLEHRRSPLLGLAEA